MKAVVYAGTGGRDMVQIQSLPRPVPGREALLVRVHAAGLNRGDVLQRLGDYHVPPGQSAIPGVEIAGTVEDWGEDVTGFARGDRVFGVVEGGGFAEYCLLDAAMANPIPAAMGFREAAATAESFLTADETLFFLGDLQRGQTVLVHAAASSVGTTMIQMAAHHGAIVYGTAGSPEKVAAVRALGAHAAFPYKERDFVAEVLRLTEGRGVSRVMDFIGGAWLGRNLCVLEPGGCLVMVGLLDGLTAEVDLLRIVERRLQIKGSSLRLRPMPEKRQVNARFRERWLDALTRGAIRPIIHAEYPMEQVAAAQEEMEANRTIGKIVLSWTAAPGA